jgi:hypothetical protein
MKNTPKKLSLSSPYCHIYVSEQDICLFSRNIKMKKKLIELREQ